MEKMNAKLPETKSPKLNVKISNHSVECENLNIDISKIF